MDLPPHCAGPVSIRPIAGYARRCRTSRDPWRAAVRYPRRLVVALPEHRHRNCRDAFQPSHGKVLLCGALSTGEVATRIPGATGAHPRSSRQAQRSHTGNERISRTMAPRSPDSRPEPPGSPESPERAPGPPPAAADSDHGRAAPTPLPRAASPSPQASRANLTPPGVSRGGTATCA